MATLFSQPSASSMKVELTKNEVYHNQNPTRLFKRIEARAWDPALSRLERSPSEAKTWVIRKETNGAVIWRRLPIHQACMNQPSSKVVLALLKYFLNSAKELDSDKRLPIHYACEHGASLNVIKILLVAHPDSINAEDISSQNPLQIHLRSANLNPSIVSALKLGPKYYRMKASRMKAECIAPFNSPLSGPPSSLLKSVDNAAKSIVISNLEEELGKSNRNLSASEDRINTLQYRVQELESKNRDYEQIKAKNQDLMNKLNKCQLSLKEMTEERREQQELDVRKDHLLQAESRNDDLKEEAERQIGKSKNGENNVISKLVNKVTSLTDELKETKEQLLYTIGDREKDLSSMKQNMKRALEEAEASRIKLEQCKEEQKSMSTEMNDLKVTADCHKATSKKLNIKLELAAKENKQMEEELVQLDSHLFEMDKSLKACTDKLEWMEIEKAELERTTKQRVEQVEKEKVELMETSMKKIEQLLYQRTELDMSTKNRFEQVDKRAKELESSIMVVIESMISRSST
jgi:hypothetical protein